MAALMLLLLLGARLIPIELGDKIVSPPAALWVPGEADGSHEDEKRPRADSAAMSDNICVLKSCKKVGGASPQSPEEADRGHGDEKKLRADSPAISFYACILKNCKRVWGEN
jgi:hypothetical protein